MKKWIAFVVLALLVVGQARGQQIPDSIATRIQLIAWSHSNGTDMLPLRLKASGLDKGDLTILEAYTAMVAKAIADDAAIPREQENGAELDATLDNLAIGMIARLSIEGRIRFSGFLKGKREAMKFIEQETTMSKHPHLVPAAFHPGTMPGGITLHYSSFTDNWLSNDGSIWYTEQSMSGYTSCQEGNICYEGRHTAQVVLFINGQGGTTTGSFGYPANNIQAFHTLSTPVNNFPGYGAQAETSTLSGYGIGQVECSFVNGILWSAFSAVSAELAWTRVQILPSPPCENPPGGGTRCYVAYACDPPSNPPDYQPVQIFTLQFGIANMPANWLSFNICFSIAGSPYLCPAAQIAGGLPNTGSWWEFVLAPGIPWHSGSFECTRAAAGTGPSLPWPF